MRLPLLVLASLLVPPAAAPAVAQTFACTEATAGQLSCQAGTACECTWFHPSAMEGTPAGWRWDCGILRPSCPGNLPATVEDYSAAIPESLSITEQSVTVQQQNEQIQWVAPELDF